MLTLTLKGSNHPREYFEADRRANAFPAVMAHLFRNPDASPLELARVMVASIRAERARGVAGHWTYSPATHAAMALYLDQWINHYGLEASDVE